MVNNHKVRLLMEALRDGKPLAAAAAKAGMSENTARKWRDLGKLPGDVRQERCAFPSTWTPNCMNVDTPERSDALLGVRHGLRSSGLNHMDSATLLAEKEGTEEARSKAACFLKIISKKNLIYLKGRSVSETEACALMVDATRFFEWYEGQINR